MRNTIVMNTIKTLLWKLIKLNSLIGIKAEANHL